MPTAFVRWMLFISSYLPLAVIYWVFLIIQHPLWAWIILSAGALGTLFTFLYIGKILPNREPMQIKIAAQKSRDSEVMSYVASYIIPFITSSFNSWQQVVATTVFLVVLGLVYISSDMICINPVLNISHYQVYEIEVEQSPETHILITRRRRQLRHGDVIRVVDAGRGIFLEVIV
jgi:hypothetical protein